MFPFIAVVLRSTLARSGSTWKVLSIGQMELFDILTVCKQMIYVKSNF